VIKPVVMEEFLARVRALLRRSGRLSNDVLEVGDLILDEPACVVRRGEAQIDLTAKEFVFARLSDAESRRCALEAPDNQPGLGLRGARPQSGAGSHRQPAPKAGSDRNADDSHGSRAWLRATGMRRRNPNITETASLRWRLSLVNLVMLAVTLVAFGRGDLHGSSLALTTAICNRN